MLADSGEHILHTPRFVRDTSQLWHRPDISREEGNLLDNISVSVLLMYFHLAQMLPSPAVVSLPLALSILLFSVIFM